MKESCPLISILVPTYNRLHYLKECLDSIVSQSGFGKNQLELIISDNSEGDETKNFIKGYIDRQTNFNIYYNKNNKNLGMVGNWNKLLDMKKGEYFIFLSDDDKFYDNFSLKLLYDNLISNQVDVCYGQYRCLHENGLLSDFQPHFNKIGNKKKYLDVYFEQLQSHSISFGGILYKDYGYRYDIFCDVWADWDFNLQYLSHHKYVLGINPYTFLYKVHTTQYSSSLTIQKYLRKFFYILNKQSITGFQRFLFQLNHINIALFMVISKFLYLTHTYSFFRKIYNYIKNRHAKNFDHNDNI